MAEELADKRREGLFVIEYIFEKNPPENDNAPGFSNPAVTIRGDFPVRKGAGSMTGADIRSTGYDSLSFESSLNKLRSDNGESTEQNEFGAPDRWTSERLCTNDEHTPATVCQVM